jgi:hypothetical protein
MLKRGCLPRLCRDRPRLHLYDISRRGWEHPQPVSQADSPRRVAAGQPQRTSSAKRLLPRLGRRVRTRRLGATAASIAGWRAHRALRGCSSGRQRCGYAAIGAARAGVFKEAQRSGATRPAQGSCILDERQGRDCAPAAPASACQYGRPSGAYCAWCSRSSAAMPGSPRSPTREMRTVGTDRHQAEARRSAGDAQEPSRFTADRRLTGASWSAHRVAVCEPEAGSQGVRRRAKALCQLAAANACICCAGAVHHLECSELGQCLQRP